MKEFASLVLMLAVLLLAMVPAKAGLGVFTDDSFSSPEELDGVEVAAAGVKLKITPENWTQNTKDDFMQWLNYENVAAVDPGDVKLASTGDEWSNLENSPYKSTYGITTTGAGDYIFILKSYWADVKVGIGRYNTATGSWENWSNPTIDWQEKKQYFKNGCSMAWDNGGYIYVLAGGSYSDTLNPSDPTTHEPRYGFWRFSVSNPYSWERLENTPWHQGPGNALVWARVNGENYIYAWIGTTSKSRGRDCGAKFYRYNIHSESWEAEPITEIGKLYPDNEVSPPYGADDGSGLVWTGGDYIYFLPGAYAENLPPNKERYFTRFVISENRWENLAMLPYNENPNTTESDGVDDGGSMVWDGGNYLYVLKGGDGNGDKAAENFWRYSISSNSWEVLAGVPFGPSKNNGKRLGYAGENVYYWHADSSGFWIYTPPRYRRSGYFTSNVFDAGTTAAWQQINWEGSEPFGALDKKRLVSAEPGNLIDSGGRLGVLPPLQVLSNPSFEFGATSSGWTLVYLGNENAGGTWDTHGNYVDGHASGRVKQVSGGLGLRGGAAEQTSSTFGTVNQTTTNTLRYYARYQYHSGKDSADLRMVIVEVEFTSGGTTYKLRYYHSNAGTPTDNATVKYIDGGYPGWQTWTPEQVYNLNENIRNKFGLATFTVEAVRVGVLMNKINSGDTTIHGLFDNIRLTKENPLDGYASTSRKDGIFEIISESYTASINQYKYAVSHASVKGTVDDFGDQQRATDGGAHSTLHEQAYTVQVSTTEKINPSDDAYVGEDSPNTAHGSANSARLGTRTQTGANRRAFLKFDLSGIPTNAAVTEARLWLRVYYYSNPTDEMRHVQCWSVADDSWTENTVTWNTQPNLVDNLDMAYIDGYKWFSWVVTDFVQDQFGGDNLVSFSIRHRDENLDDISRAIYYRSKESDVDDPYLEVTYAVPRTHYDLEIHQNIDNLPLGTNHTLQIRYKLSNANEKFRVMVKDIAGNWSYRGESLDSSTDWELWEYKLLDNEFIADGDGPGNNVRIKLVDYNDGATGATDLLIDYIRVKSTKADNYVLRWEHRITGIENIYENVILRIYGYNATDDENVIVSVWNQRAGEWEDFAKSLPRALGEITHRLTNVNDYLAGDDISIKYEDVDKTDDIQTTICIDHVVLEAQKPYSTVLRVWARSSADNFTWSDWVENPSDDSLPWENRYLQYSVVLSTTDFEVTPVLHELIAYYVPWKPRVGTFISQALELGYVENWGMLSWEATLPENTSISFATRSSPDGLNWSEWEELESNAIQSPTHGMLYLQVQATLRGVGALSPTLRSYSIAYTPERAAGQTALLAAVGAVGIAAAGVVWALLRGRLRVGRQKQHSEKSADE
ncbi:MAG: DNRLRE domain-containing protein [Candidatus Hadarchaeaceae archaeon]